MINLFLDGYSTRYITGIILLVINPIVGFAGLLLSCYLARKTCHKFYLSLGIGLYLLSWLMTLAGIILIGREGLAILQPYINRLGFWPVLVSFMLLVYIIYAYKKKRKNCA